MPGTPNVIIGFNNDIAWGVTNVGADVVDWYQVKFKDAKKKNIGTITNGKKYKNV
jgi:penicillin amidase